MVEKAWQQVTPMDVGACVLGSAPLIYLGGTGSRDNFGGRDRLGASRLTSDSLPPSTSQRFLNFPKLVPSWGPLFQTHERVCAQEWRGGPCLNHNSALSEEDTVAMKDFL